MQKRYVIICSSSDEPGTLARVLAFLASHHINLKQIESRKSYSSEKIADIYIEFWHDFESTTPLVTFCDILAALRNMTLGLECIAEGTDTTQETDQVPWFPKNKRDLDVYSTRVLDFGEALEADHPGFLDPAYRARRLGIVQLAKTHISGEPIPRIDYTELEIATWRTVFSRLKAMYPSHACREYLQGFNLLQSEGIYSENSIPQLEEISNYLKARTGFSLKPVMGLLSSRDFLNGLAFRVFHSTQYIRHASKPFYTPEPDVCHELLGHVPLFCDRDFASFSQEIGLASLGASDEAIEKLASIYWFTIEFGLTEESDSNDPEAPKSTRAYGAGLLSSFGELEYCLSDDTVVKKDFDPSMASVTKYPITSYQPLYYVAKSFKDAQARIKAFSETLRRPFRLRYDPYTQSIVVLDRKEKIISYASELSLEFQNLLKSFE